MDLKELIGPWFDFVETRYSGGTAYIYKIHVSQFLDWLGKRPLNKCNIEDHITDCVKRKYAKVTVNGKLSAIKSFCGWYCPRYDLPDPSAEIDFFPHKDMKPKRQRFLTIEEHQKVLDVAEPGIERDTFELFCNTGLRRAEYLALKPADIDKKETHLTVRHGKGNKERKVPPNTKAKDIIARNTSPEKTLLCVTYWRDKGDNIWLWCQSLARRAGVPAFGPHACRHYFATRLIKSGVPIKMVSQILGHSSVLMTEQVYCHLIPEDTTGVTECLCS